MQKNIIQIIATKEPITATKKMAAVVVALKDNFIIFQMLHLGFQIGENVANKYMSIE